MRVKYSRRRKLDYGIVLTDLAGVKVIFFIVSANSKKEKLLEKSRESIILFDKSNKSTTLEG